MQLLRNRVERGKVKMRAKLAALEDAVRRLVRSPREGQPAADIFARGMFPVCVATHDQGVRWLFDLATVVLLLDGRPGDRILDLGAGSGFSSEMLARLGYEVVAIDPDLVALSHNRRRPGLDRSRIAGTVTVVGAIAERLPFADGTFDGAIGMNVLHHVPDLNASVIELARVLRPGAVAAFCEPGLDHLAAPETQRAIIEHGEADLAFDVLKFLESARQHGFSDAMLSATLQSPLRLLPIQEIDTYLSGHHWRPHLTPRGVLDELHKRHSYSALVRAGVRPKTSRRPNVLRAEVTVEGLPQTALRGRSYDLHARLANTGDTEWLTTPTEYGGYVSFGCKLVTADGRLVDDTIARTALPHNILPGTEVSVLARFVVPLAVAPGAYRVRFDAVNELRCWFADLRDPGALPSTVLLVE